MLFDHKGCKKHIFFQTEQLLRAPSAQTPAPDHCWVALPGEAAARCEAQLQDTAMQPLDPTPLPTRRAAFLFMETFFSPYPTFLLLILLLHF